SRTPAGTAGSCTSNGECPSGQTCDLGLCSDSPPHESITLNFGNLNLTSWPQDSPAILVHKRMLGWGNNHGSGNFFGGSAIYNPSASTFTFFEPGLRNRIPVISGEPTSVDGVSPLHLPLFTQRDRPGAIQSVSTNLRDCLDELRRDRPFVVEGFPPPSIFDSS